MGRQLGWVWFGGREYKIVVFYMTNDNSVFCRENDDDPVLLVSQLPKRVPLNITGTISAIGSNSSSVGPEQRNFIGPIGFSFGNYLIIQANPFTGTPAFEFTLGNTLDDLRVIDRSTIDYPFIDGNKFRLTIDMEITRVSAGLSGFRSGSVQIGSISQLWVSGPNSDNEIIYNGVNTLTGIPSGNINTKGYLPNAYVSCQAGFNSQGVSSWNYNFINISNTFGFTARVLPSKTIFAVTDNISRASFTSFKGRITTGTLDAFATYELPVVPVLDSDLFQDGDETPSDEKAPYSIVSHQKLSNYYLAGENVVATVYLSNPFQFIRNDIFTRDALISESEITVRVFDSAIHQNSSQAIPKQIPGLPADTKAVLGVLACPV